MGFLQRDASMRALWSDRQKCSHNVPQKVKRIHKRKALNFRENFGESLARKSVPLKKSFVLNFVLQMCHPKSEFSPGQQGMNTNGVPSMICLFLMETLLYRCDRQLQSRERRDPESRRKYILYPA